MIVDMGSGALPLGRALFEQYKMFDAGYRGKHIIALLTHYHWDHIQGMPFFAPLYSFKNTFHFHGMEPRQDAHDDSELRNKVLMMLQHQQSTPSFPLPFRELPASKKFVAHSPMFSERLFYYFDGESLEFETDNMGLAANRIGPGRSDPGSYISLSTVPLNHPDNAVGYHIRYMGKSVSFVFDNENMAYPNMKIAAVCKDTDMIFMDCQYDQEQLSGMTQGFGHGQIELNLCEAAAMGAKVMIASHHDPNLDDVGLADREVKAQKFLEQKNLKGSIGFEMAKEGDCWIIGG